jgi:limonene-1,2-epoxide hydrolase
MTTSGISGDNERRVRDFFAAWGQDFTRFCDSFPAIMSADCLLIQSGIPDIRGPDQALSLLRAAREHAGIETIRVELRQLIAIDRCVVSERIDHLLSADRRLLASVPCVGVMEFDCGKIAGWREYFDSKLMDGLPGARLLT